MKTVFTLILFTIVLIGCKKEKKPQSTDPSITNVVTTCTPYNTQKAVQFQFNISTGVAIKKVELMKSPGIKISELTTPQTGMYTMYHVVTSCPISSDNAMYYFLITKDDNSIVATTQFKVSF